MTSCLEVVRNKRLCSGAIEYEAEITNLKNGTVTTAYHDQLMYDWQVTIVNKGKEIERLRAALLDILRPVNGMKNGGIMCRAIARLALKQSGEEKQE